MSQIATTISRAVLALSRAGHAARQMARAARRAALAAPHPARPAPCAARTWPRAAITAPQAAGQKQATAPNTDRAGQRSAVRRSASGHLCLCVVLAFVSYDRIATAQQAALLPTTRHVAIGVYECPTNTNNYVADDCYQLTACQISRTLTVQSVPPNVVYSATGFNSLSSSFDAAGIESTFQASISQSGDLQSGWQGLGCPFNYAIPVRCLASDDINFRVSRPLMIRISLSGARSAQGSDTETLTVSSNSQYFASVNQFQLDLPQIVQLQPYTDYTASFYGRLQPSGLLFDATNIQGRIEVLGPCTTVLEQPTSVTTCAGMPVEFRFRVESVPLINRQWRRNGVSLRDGITSAGSIISGSHDETLSISNIQTADGGNYDCIVASPIGICTNGTSIAVPLTIENAATAVTIAAHPSAFDACAGESGSLTVSVVSPLPITYQWYGTHGNPLRDGPHIMGSRSATLMFVNGTEAETGVYDCQVISGCTQLNSGIATAAFKDFGACCYSDGACILSPDGCNCPNGGRFINGVHFPNRRGTCTPSPCYEAGVPRGACCSTMDGTCSLDQRSLCSGDNTFQGEGTTCPANPCTPIMGVCHQAMTGGCRTTTVSRCEPGWDFYESRQSCNPPPRATPSGTCCYNHLCLDGLTFAQCQAAGETWLQQCDGPICLLPPQVCCIGAACVVVQRAEPCAGARFSGLATCTYAPCRGGVPIVGVCCRGATCEMAAIPGACTGPNTLFIPTTTECNQSGNHVAACCNADFNHVGGVTLQDIFDFLTAFMASDASADIDHSGIVAVQDIFDFLAAFFTGCSNSAGACCNGTHCSITTSSACTGIFQSAGSVCGPTGNPTTCCPANFDQSNGLAIQDIFDFLAAWFSRAPNANFNHVGDFDIQDIFDFLAAWFAGCS